ncbi:MAG: radical SAM protein, partial [Limisphaerales bacterium]
LMAAGEFSPPKLATLETALDLSLALKRGRVFADTWNLELFASCTRCLEARRCRLHEMNLTQQVSALPSCKMCGAA